MPSTQAGSLLDRSENPNWNRAKPIAARSTIMSHTALDLVENPDILATIGKHESLRPTLVVGFAAETDDLAENARKKLAAKGADWILANDVSPETGIMGGEENAIRLVTAAGVEDWPRLAKSAVAERLIARIAKAFAEHREAA